MGYYADVDGTIHPVNDEAAEEILRLLDEKGYFETYRDDYIHPPYGGTGKRAIHIWQRDKYWEDEYYEFFDKTKGLIDDGLIECVGEDGEMWCFEKRTRWSFGDSADDYWLTDMDGLQRLAECGFTVYESEEFGYFFGIDGAGYSFFEEHWIPLYKARGLHWHKEEEVA